MIKKKIFKGFTDKFEFLDVAIFIIVLLFFHICYGLETINPTNINWLMSVYHDWGQHYLGWAFYRNDPWTFPLGTIESYNYPVGSNIGFTDSIPLLGIIFKPFSSILPDDFQYLGFWLFICTYFVAIYTKKILQLYNASNWIIVFAILIMIANPVILFRAIHPALCSHFLILGSIYNYLRPSLDNSKKVNLNQVFLFCIAALVNPYIMVMIFGFNLIVPLKHFLFDKTVNLKKLILYPVVSLLLLVALWIIIGLIELTEATSVASVEPFSLYSFNLNSFFDPYGYYSKFIPDLGRWDARQYEGFAYFGFGMLTLSSGLLIYSVYFYFTKKFKLVRIKKYLLLVILCLAMFVFSVTNVISFGADKIISFPIPSILEKLGFIFRASGRFVWPLYYLIFIVSIILFTRIKINSQLKIVILFFITTVQLFDTQELYTRWNLPNGTYKTALRENQWITLFKNFEDIIIYPAFDYNYSINYNNDYQDLDFIALKAGKPISNGYVARANTDKAQKFNNQLMLDLSSATIGSERLFITTDKNIHGFDALLSKEIVDIHTMDRFIFIYKKNKSINSRIFKENFTSKSFLDSIKSHYKAFKTFDFEWVKYKMNNDKKIKYFFDSYVFDNNSLLLRGWAFLEESNNNKNDKIFLVLSSGNNIYEIALKSEIRKDITAAFKRENLDYAGFKGGYNIKSVPKGSYSIGLVIKNITDGNVYIKSEKNITIK